MTDAGVVLEPGRPVRQRTSGGDLFVFVHIPKTGGTTLFALMAERFAPDQVISIDDRHTEESFRSMPEGDLRRCRLMRAHYGYAIYRFLPRRPVFLTMLRDPVQRTVSEYRHIARVETHRMHSDVVRAGLTLEDFVRDPRNRPHVQNTQVRSLVGRRHPRASDLSDADQLTIAYHRLEEFAFFGLIERMDESIDLLAYTLGWGPWAAVPRLNPSERGDRPWEVDDDTRRAIEERNALDLALYARAQEVFAERMRRMTKEAALLSAHLGWVNFEEALHVSPDPASGLPIVPRLLPPAPPPGPGKTLSRWVVQPLGRVRRLVVPVGSAAERGYLGLRRRILGW